MGLTFGGCAASVRYASGGRGFKSRRDGVLAAGARCARALPVKSRRRSNPA